MSVLKVFSVRKKSKRVCTSKDRVDSFLSLKSGLKCPLLWIQSCCYCCCCCCEATPDVVDDDVDVTATTMLSFFHHGGGGPTRHLTTAPRQKSILFQLRSSVMAAASVTLVISEARILMVQFTER